jgi:hypothetical protein
MQPADRQPNAEVIRLCAEHARLAAALHAVARTYQSTYEDVMVVSRQISAIDDAIRLALAEQARWEAAHEARRS